MTSCTRRDVAAPADDTDDVPPGHVRLRSGQVVTQELAAQVLPPPGAGRARPGYTEAPSPAVTACCVQDELEQLRAELTREREARARAEGEVAGFERAFALLAREVAAARASALAPSRSPVTLPQRDAQRDSVTPSVTVTLEEGGGGEEEKALRKREKAKLRKRNQRVRESSVTPSKASPLPPPSVSETRGALAVVTVAARDVQRDRQRDGLREHGTPATLPAQVQALRAAWNELAAPHGFPPWGERTSRELLADAQAALERRPLEEWRQAFAWVPRSPVCRGELDSRQRASLVWLLRGRTRDGYEVAEKLLGGGWSLDPDPEGSALGEPGAAMCREGASPSSEAVEAARAWALVLEGLRAEGKRYCVEQLQRARPVAVEDGHLVVELPDRFALAWAEDSFAELLNEHAARLGYAGVRLVAGEEGAAP